MALTQKAKQAKTLKKQQKRKLKLKSNIPHKLNSTSVKSGEIHQCYIAEPNSQCPFYHVIISRINETTNTIVSVTFMINPTLTGVEDVYKMIDDIPSFYHLIDYNISEGILTLKQHDPAIGKKFILQAVDRAKSLSRNPHPDYNSLKEIFFDIEDTSLPIPFKFGE